MSDKKPVRVRGLSHLVRLARARRAVYFNGGILPAAFVVNWNGWMLHILFWRGMFVYQPKERKHE
jgi:NADH:ubiquinone oxidoreductase subunit